MRNAVLKVRRQAAALLTGLARGATGMAEALGVHRRHTAQLWQKPDQIAWRLSRSAVTSWSPCETGRVSKRVSFWPNPDKHYPKSGAPQERRATHGVASLVLCSMTARKIIRSP